MSQLIEFSAMHPPKPPLRPVSGITSVHFDEDVVELTLETDSVRFGWGHEGLVGTTAFWADQARTRYVGVSLRLGRDLVEEIAACILGGFGMPAEVGLAAFERLRQEGALRQPEQKRIETLLREPLSLPGGQTARYRFPRQRAQRVCAALRFVQGASWPHDGRQLRDWLLRVPGVGPKTAGWIARNHTGCQDVAIIDVHLRRAGVAAGFFSPTWQVSRDYERFEATFLAVAQLARVNAAELDACIWGTLHGNDAVRRAVGRLSAQAHAVPTQSGSPPTAAMPGVGEGPRPRPRSPALDC